jgi:transcriptional regulator GlxA family with amidase domain
VIVPPLWSRGVAELEQQVERLRRHGDFLKGMMQRTRHIAAACSGVVLLAQAGLLDGCRATTCWWLLPWFAEHFPEVKLYGERLVVKSGEYREGLCHWLASITLRAAVR